MNTNIRGLLTRRIEIIPKRGIPKKVFETGLGIAVCGMIMIICLGLYVMAVYGFEPLSLSLSLRQGVDTGFVMMFVGTDISLLACFCGKATRK